MRKPMAKKVLAASLAAAMTMSVAACGNNTTPASTASTDTTPASDDTVESVVESTEEEEVSEYTVLIDPATGKPYDLGGIEVVIRDWFTSPERKEAQSDYEEAQYAYQDWIQETYNFKIHGETIGDWGSVAQDFVDYATSGGDNNNYVFTIPQGFSTTIFSAVNNGLVYDLSTLDCLDFSEQKFANGVHKLFTIDGGIYAMRAGWVEPRTGLYFNKKILSDAGVDPDSIYDMQANDTWTWEAFENILQQVQQDTDNDGTIDIWGLGLNEGVMVTAAVFSNGGKYVGVDADGNYTYEFESQNTLDALEWVRDMFNKYDWNGPVDDEGNAAAWDYYQNQFKTGGCAFCCDQQYCATPGNLFYETEDEIGFVMFPKGPNGSLTQCAEDNINVIPSCYDADTAWKIAFAYSLYNEFVPGYEDLNPYINTTATGNFDERAYMETVPKMSQHYELEYQALIPNLDMGAPFTWKFYPDMAPISEIVDGFRDMYKQYIDEANQ